MRNRRRRKKGCAKKKPYTKEQALARRKQLAQKFGVAMSAYRCRACNSYHVGRMPKHIKEKIWPDRNKRS